MECKICKGKTTWSSSIGLYNFLVCNKCVHKMAINVKDLLKADKEYGGQLAVSYMINTIGEAFDEEF